MDITWKRRIIIYTTESLQCKAYNFTTKFDEALFISIKMKDRDSLLLGSIYRSPTSSDENNNHLNKLIDEISQTGFPYIMLAGDFNFPKID